MEELRNSIEESLKNIDCNVYESEGGHIEAISSDNNFTIKIDITDDRRKSL